MKNQEALAKWEIYQMDHSTEAFQARDSSLKKEQSHLKKRGLQKQ